MENDFTRGLTTEITTLLNRTAKNRIGGIPQTTPARDPGEYRKLCICTGTCWGNAQGHRRSQWLLTPSISIKLSFNESGNYD